MDSEQELDLEETIKEAADILRQSKRVLILSMKDEDDGLCVIRKGVAEIELPWMLKKFAEMFARHFATELVQKLVADSPESMRGRCPACLDEVLVIPPADAIQPLFGANKIVVSVCSCGAILSPSQTDDGKVSLRELQDNDLDDMPDELREKLLEMRAANHKLQRKRRSQKAN